MILTVECQNCGHEMRICINTDEYPLDYLDGNEVECSSCDAMHSIGIMIDRD